MKRRIRPIPNGVIWTDCDMDDEEVPDAYRRCWCQSFPTEFTLSTCGCECHLDENSRGVYGK